jgi:outer membrane protein
MKSIKFFLISVLFVCSSSLLQGQAERGKFLLGGSSSLSIKVMKDKYMYGEESHEGGKETDIAFSPRGGYFLTDGLAAGFLIPLNINSYNYNSSNLTRTALAIAPFARYYFGKTVIRPFLQGSAGSGYLTYRDDSGKESGTMFLWEIDAGMAVFIRDNIALELEVGYSSVTTRQKDPGEFDPDTEITSGFGLSIGFSFIL